MNAVFLLAPFLLIRFGLLSLIDKGSLRRAAHFAPVQGRERGAYYVYQSANAGLFLMLPFLTVRVSAWQFVPGLVCYLLGLILCAAAVASFSMPDQSGLNTNGLYQLSRNPMYVAYFVCFFGMVLLTGSLLLLAIVLLFQISAHWIILSEERWCAERFGADYQKYRARVRRYL